MAVNESFHYSRSLALSWALDRVTAHARKATDLLMALCDWDFWTSPRFFGTDYEVPWRGQIETGGLCHLAACGYDWLYDFMTEAERHRLRTCLLYKGILPIVQDYADPLTRLPVASHMRPYYNFWQVSVALAGEATMALYREHPLAERYARLCKDASDWWFRFEGWTVPVLPKRQQDLRAGSYFPPNFDSEGGYWEGLNYMDGVLISSFYFGESYRRQTGVEILPMDLMRKVAGLILNASFRMGDRMRGVNFSDSRAGFATSPNVTAYLARRLRHSGLQWFLQNCRNNFNDASLLRYCEMPAFTYLWYDPALKPQEPEGAVPVKVYPGMGVAVMRSGWGHDDTMLAFKCGVTAGHSHADANSFVLYSRDELLLVDSGVCGYEMPEYLGYYHTTRAHSSVLVGGEGQIKRLAGKIVEQDDGEMKQETQAYVIRKGKAALSVRMIEPKECRLAIKQGYKTYNEDFTVVKSSQEKQKELERSDYFEITPARNEKRQRFLTVLYPFAAGGTEPVIHEVRKQGWVGVRVSREGGHRVDLVGLRLSGSGGGLEQVETDAPLFCLTRDEKGEPKQAMVYSGTYLKAGGKTILASPKPATLAIEL
ncbi:MAG: heparinase II/III family protein [Planctomycetes bacterium]|nr:heparinase II/III family protein [Planctomycetota bacterium]MBU4400812.1 heparinase II/III family protein [Planctomycetota bacterium]MCG2683288.1 heparinase II/III family protein [Planctomycetales bacterium]